MSILEILENSLNCSEKFGGSLKSPWIWKMILEILEFCAQCNISNANFRIDAATRHFHISWTQFEHPWKSQKDPWNILELSLNFVDRISWQPWLSMHVFYNKLTYPTMLSNMPLRKHTVLLLGIIRYILSINWWGFVNHCILSNKYCLFWSGFEGFDEGEASPFSNSSGEPGDWYLDCHTQLASRYLLWCCTLWGKMFCYQLVASILWKVGRKSRAIPL